MTADDRDRQNVDIAYALGWVLLFLVFTHPQRITPYLQWIADAVGPVFGYALHVTDRIVQVTP